MASAKTKIRHVFGDTFTPSRSSSIFKIQWQLPVGIAYLFSLAATLNVPNIYFFTSSVLLYFGDVAQSEVICEQITDY